jgi:collagenase-like PrtC family protease
VDCGACALRALLRAGVRAAKIEGRNNDLPRKLQDVRFLSALLRDARDPSLADDELRRRAREGFRVGYSGVCSDLSCYYREYLSRCPAPVGLRPT